MSGHEADAKMRRERESTPFRPSISKRRHPARTPDSVAPSSWPRPLLFAPPSAIIRPMQDFYNIDPSSAKRIERSATPSAGSSMTTVLPIIGDCYVEGRFPREIVPGLAELGVLGANLPEEYGCAGLNNSRTASSCRGARARRLRVVRSFASVQGALVMYPHLRLRHRATKETALSPKMASGDIIGCFGLTEPDFGSHPAGRITMAREQSDGSWVITARRCGSPTAPRAMWRVVWRRRTMTRIMGRSVASSCPRTRRAFGQRTRRESSPCARPTRVSSCSRTFAFPGRAATEDEWPEEPVMCLTQRVTGSRGARWAPPWPASRKRPLTRRRHHVRPPHRRLPAATAAARRNAHRDRQGAAPVRPARPPQDRGDFTPRGSRSRSATRALATDIAREARRLSAPTGFSPSIPRCDTWRTRERVHH